MIDWTFLRADLCSPVKAGVIHHTVHHRVGFSVGPSDTLITIFITSAAKNDITAAGTYVMLHLFLHKARTQTAIPAVNSSSPMAMPTYTGSKQEGSQLSLQRGVDSINRRGIMRVCKDTGHKFS